MRCGSINYSQPGVTAMRGILLLAVAASVSTSAFAADQTCAALIAALPKLSGSTPLAASGTGQTYKQLYDQCDAANKFAGQALPKHNGKPLKCSTDKNRVGFLSRYPDGTIAFQAKAGVDADGSKLACGTGWPNQCGTWLTFDQGSERKDVNAEDTPFVVVPTDMPGTGISFQRDSGVKRGDLAVIVAKGRCVFGVVGDAGPYFRLGEISLRAQSDLNNPQCKVKDQYPCKAIIGGGGGVGIPSGVTYLIFPGTRPSPLWSQNVNSVGDSAGRKRVEKFLSDLVH
jgi:hypothetical protein